MSTAERMVTPTLELGANRVVAATLVSQLQHRAPLGASRADTYSHDLRVRHLVASRRAEAMRLADRARWSQHDADACWYAGKLRAARQLDAQAARERDLAAWLTAEADAIGRS